MTPVRWGILGTAAIARKIVHGIGQSPTSVVQTVASRDYTRAGEFAREYGIPRAVGSYEELIQSQEIDAVYVPLPNSMHAEWTIKALEAGKHVLCEKPFAISAAQAAEVASVSKRTGLLVAEAFMYRFHPMYDVMFALLHEGAIGQIKTIDSAFSFPLDDRDSIVASAELAGGALMDVGCYCVNFSRMVAACEPERAIAFERRSTVDDTLIGALEFPNGVLAHLECSIETADRRYAQITGTQGSITLEEPWLPEEDEAQFILRRNDDHTETVKTPGGNSYRLEIDNFAHAVRTGEPLRWPPQDAIQNMAAIEALLRSAKQGKAVAVDSL